MVGESAHRFGRSVGPGAECVYCFVAAVRGEAAQDRFRGVLAGGERYFYCFVAERPQVLELFNAGPFHRRGGDTDFASTATY